MVRQAHALLLLPQGGLWPQPNADFGLAVPQSLPPLRDNPQFASLRQGLTTTATSTHRAKKSQSKSLKAASGRNQTSNIQHRTLNTEVTTRIFRPRNCGVGCSMFSVSFLSQGSTSAQNTKKSKQNSLSTALEQSQTPRQVLGGRGERPHRGDHFFSASKNSL